MSFYFIPRNRVNRFYLLLFYWHVETQRNPKRVSMSIRMVMATLIPMIVQRTMRPSFLVLMKSVTKLTTTVMDKSMKAYCSPSIGIRMVMVLV